ncbi:MAG: hypothetical protein ACTH31_06280 [Pseudoclavibacter sp.]
MGNPPQLTRRSLTVRVASWHLATLRASGALPLVQQFLAFAQALIDVVRRRNIRDRNARADEMMSA